MPDKATLLPTPQKKKKPLKKGPAPKKPVKGLPHFLRDKDTPKADFRTLKKFMHGQVHENLHAVGQVQQMVQRIILLLDAVSDRDTKLLESGLLGSDTTDIRASLKRQEPVRLAMRSILREVSNQRMERIRELVDMEHSLEREARHQRHEAAELEHKKKQAQPAPAATAIVVAASTEAPDAAPATKEATVRLEPNEENGAPTLNLDPTLLAAATAHLAALPEVDDAEKSAEPTIEGPVGKVKNG